MYSGIPNKSSGSRDIQMVNMRSDHVALDFDDDVSSEKKLLSATGGSDLQNVIMCYFGVLGFACLLVLYGSMLGIVLGTNGSLETDIETNLHDQISKQAFATLHEAGDFLIRTLNKYDESVISVVSLGTENVFRSDYNTPLGGYPNPTLYWDMEAGVSGLKAPTGTTPRFGNKIVSLDASSSFVTSLSNSDIQTTSDSGSWTGVDATMKQTTYLDDSLIHMWDNNPQLLQIFLGFNTGPPSLRRYPGRAVYTETFVPPQADPKLYNPTLRGWYLEAVKSPKKTIFTAPYPDFHGLGWMITGARTLYDYPLNPGYVDIPIGVVGVDILIGSIAEVLNSIKFLETGKLSLFTGANGQIVTDSEWDYLSATTEAFYDVLANPAVSTSTWEQIAQTPVGTVQEISIENSSGAKELIYVKHLSEYGGQYYMTVFVTEDEIMLPLKPALESMKSSNVSVTITLVTSLFVSMILLLGLMVLIIRSIIKVFNIMEQNVEKLLRNVGTANTNLGDGMVQVHESVSNELQHLESSMNSMIELLQRNRVVDTTTDANQAAGGALGGRQLKEMWDFVPMSAMEESAPPMTLPPPPYSE